MGVVFARSRDGNTVTNDPSSLEGGAIDEYPIYEGLSRTETSRPITLRSS